VTPYFKGLHLTLASHHPGGGAGSWKMALKEWAFYLQEAVELGKLSEAEALSMTQAALEPTEPEPWEGQACRPTPPPKLLPAPPKLIMAIPRLIENVKALGILFDTELPSQDLLRSGSAQVYTILYGFADASGSGFESTVLVEGGIRYQIGFWGSDLDEESSNYREFENVVDALRAEAAVGNLRNSLLSSAPTTQR
jgi:hypothetical protein